MNGFPDGKSDMIEKIENSKNVVTARIDAGGNVTVGDTTVINLKEAALYKTLQAELVRLDEKFDKTRSKIEKYPDDEDFKLELLQLSEERNKRQKELDTLTREVLKLAEEFCRIPINTERLRKAKQHFEAGEFTEARAVLDAEKMGNELDNAIQKEALGKQLQSQAKAEREKLANEYLILAGLTAIDFTRIDWFEKTREYFELSLEAERNGKALFSYGKFLLEHNQFIQAKIICQEALEVVRSLAESDPKLYLPNVSTTLINLATLCKLLHEFEKAELFYEEALEILMSLINYNKNTYLPIVANLFNLIGNLKADKYEFDLAIQAYKKALKIAKDLSQHNYTIYLQNKAAILANMAYVQADKQDLNIAKINYKKALRLYKLLAEADPRKYLPAIATLLNNLANVHADKYEFKKAELNYEEALRIRKDLALLNPRAYLPAVAETLNNIGTVQEYNNELVLAEQSYKEALGIYRTLSKDNFQSYSPAVAATAVNICTFHSSSIPDKTKSITYAEETLLSALPFLDSLPAAQEYTRTALQVVKAWGEDPQAFLQKIRDQLNNPQP